MHKKIDGFGYYVASKWRENNLFHIFHIFLEALVEFHDKLEVILILWKVLYKSMFYICLIIFNKTLPKNVDVFRLPIPKWKETLYSICETYS